MPNILKATAWPFKGAEHPTSYNTSGYERVEILKLLDGVVDIYLPDLKFMHPTRSGLSRRRRRLSRHYPAGHPRNAPTVGLLDLNAEALPGEAS